MKKPEEIAWGICRDHPFGGSGLLDAIAEAIRCGRVEAMEWARDHHDGDGIAFRQEIDEQIERIKGEEAQG